MTKRKLIKDGNLGENKETRKENMWTKPEKRKRKKLDGKENN
jgi:hypothetical protein